MLFQKQLSKYNLLDNKIDANDNATDEAHNDQSMFVLAILEKSNEKRD